MDDSPEKFLKGAQSDKTKRKEFIDSLEKSLGVRPLTGAEYLETKEERHGPAVLVVGPWNDLRAVKNCRLANAARVTLESTLTDTLRETGERRAPRAWRYRLKSGEYRWGRIKIEPNDVHFEADQSLCPRHPLYEATPPDLENDLLSDDRMKELVTDDAFAGRLWGALCNTAWRSVTDANSEWGCSFRYAGGLVASLRGLGEYYPDWMDRGDAGVVPEDVGAELSRLGWYQIDLPEPDYLSDRSPKQH